ncbi:hypothetical protein M9H77_14633 [Catharanthus roseus]|uniref:Uncharacterized protein n=1 Tax=Catharanthus roseus TaxID=4058 RepID=A0ACC0BNK2_CATRO|nr:hypothetical protein M9H77_14633 [Catharanthus roseus]
MVSSKKKNREAMVVINAFEFLQGHDRWTHSKTFPLLPISLSGIVTHVRELDSYDYSQFLGHCTSEGTNHIANATLASFDLICPLVITQLESAYLSCVLSDEITSCKTLFRDLVKPSLVYMKMTLSGLHDSELAIQRSSQGISLRPKMNKRYQFYQDHEPASLRSIKQQLILVPSPQAATKFPPCKEGSNMVLATAV